MSICKAGRRQHNVTLRAAAICLVTAASVLTLGITDAGARAYRGGGTMARSSVSGVNRANVNTRDINRGNVNTGNINTGDINRNVNVNVNGGYHGGYHPPGYPGYRPPGYYHPVARAVTIGAIAVTTAAVAGSMYYALPPTGCSTVVMNGISYSQCGSAFYQQTWAGNDVVYVVVNP